jgi:hypothetical protein
MQQSDNEPMLIYQEGHTHFVSASILIANFSRHSLTKIKVNKSDMASFGDFVSNSLNEKYFEMLLPNSFIVIDELSSFDLEYLSHYSISYIQENKRCELKFDLEKYTGVKPETQVQYFDNINVKGKIIDTIQ